LCNSSHDLRCHPKETHPFSNKAPWFNEFFVIWQQSERFLKDVRQVLVLPTAGWNSILTNRLSTAPPWSSGHFDGKVCVVHFLSESELHMPALWLLLSARQSFVPEFALQTSSKQADIQHRNLRSLFNY
jgi:hypothetical protein